MPKSALGGLVDSALAFAGRAAAVVDSGRPPARSDEIERASIAQAAVPGQEGGVDAGFAW